MSQFLTILVTIARVAGSKLPQVWPHLLHIASDLKEIAKILGIEANVNPSFTATEESTEFAELCRNNGCSEDECNELIASANAIDEALDSADE